MKLKEIFYVEGSRFRFGWRLLIFLLLLLAAIFPLILLKNALMQFTGATILLILGLFLNANFLDKRPFSTYGLIISKQSLFHFFVGLFIGFTTVSLLLFLGVFTETLSLSVTSKELNIHLLTLFGYKMLLVAIIEESFYRGYLLSNLREALQSKQSKYSLALPSAILISSILFGVAHAGNHNASFLSMMFLTINGMVWCIPFVMTKNLALSIGLHASWNFAQSLFGFAMSGNQSNNSLYIIENTGSPFWTGGPYGPEAGVLGLIGYLLMLAFSVAFLKLTGNDSNKE